jgi:hypothetical protein
VLAGALTATIPGALVLPSFDVLIRRLVPLRTAPAPAREPPGEPVPVA